MPLSGLTSCQLSRGFCTSIPIGSALYSQRRFFTVSGVSPSALAAQANTIAAVHAAPVGFQFIACLLQRQAGPVGSGVYALSARREGTEPGMRFYYSVGEVETPKGGEES